MKSIRFYTFGCKVNQYDTQMMRTVISSKFNIVDDDCADIFIINTCSVTGESERKARQLIRRISREHPDSKIVVIGCYPQYNPDELRDIGVSAILGNACKKDILKHLERIDRSAVGNGFKPFPTKPIIEEPLIITGEIPDEFWDLPIYEFFGHTRAFIKIEDGCDGSCSYCVVPFVRGRPVSRPVDSILKEIKTLEDKGVKEIVLTGIRLGRYRYNGVGLSELVEKILQNASIARIRMSSIELEDIDDKLINLLACGERLCNHLHIPLQSGSNKILQMMNRKYSYEEYKEKVFYLKKRVENVNITTDIIVGFPGETEEDFQRSFYVVEEIEFGKVHVFSFSIREKTQAVNLPGRITRELIKERASLLRRKVSIIAKKFKQRFFNQVMSVLVEGKIDTSYSYLQGFTSNYIRVKIDYDKSLVGRLVNVKLLNFLNEDVYGKEV